MRNRTFTLAYGVLLMLGVGWGFAQETVKLLELKKPRQGLIEESPYLSLRISSSLKYSFPKCLEEPATSILLMTLLLVGTTPTGICALMCERHARVKSQRHCIQPSDSMPGMAHDHSAMIIQSVEAVSAVSVSQSCQTNCVTAERFNVWRKDFTAVWGLDSGPPAPPCTCCDFFHPPHLSFPLSF